MNYSDAKKDVLGKLIKMMQSKMIEKGELPEEEGMEEEEVIEEESDPMSSAIASLLGKEEEEEEEPKEDSPTVSVLGVLRNSKKVIPRATQVRFKKKAK